MTTPSPFCTSLPTQLRAWDATALKSYMLCPRRYQYEIVEGWRGGSIHLDWGRMYHASLEAYDRAILAGLTHDEATDIAVAKALEVSWIADENGPGKPWGGSYQTVWRCTDEGPPFKSGARKGQPNLKKACERAQTDQYGESPGLCGDCGRPVTTRVVWVSADPKRKKDRYTLVRSVIEFCDTMPRGLKPLMLPGDIPAVELTFQFPLPFNTPDGEPYLLTGNLDGLADISGENVIREKKTTGSSLGSYFFDGFAPNTQVDTYDLAGYLLFPTLNLKGVLLEATSTQVGESRVQRGFIGITQGRREEWFGEIEYWIKRAEEDAKRGKYAKNTANCSQCPFKKICKLDPEVRASFLPSHFEKSYWNPLEIRGESAYLGSPALEGEINDGTDSAREPAVAG